MQDFIKENAVAITKLKYIFEEFYYYLSSTNLFDKRNKRLDIEDPHDICRKPNDIPFRNGIELTFRNKGHNVTITVSNNDPMTIVYHSNDIGLQLGIIGDSSEDIKETFLRIVNFLNGDLLP